MQSDNLIILMAMGIGGYFLYDALKKNQGVAQSLAQTFSSYSSNPEQGLPLFSQSPGQATSDLLQQIFNTNRIGGALQTNSVSVKDLSIYGGSSTPIVDPTGIIQGVLTAP